MPQTVGIKRPPNWRKVPKFQQQQNKDQYYRNCPFPHIRLFSMYMPWPDQPTCCVSHSYKVQQLQHFLVQLHTYELWSHDMLYIRCQQIFVWWPTHILERVLTARYPIWMIFNHNSTIPPNDAYLIIQISNQTTIGLIGYHITVKYLLNKLCPRSKNLCSAIILSNKTNVLIWLPRWNVFTFVQL